MADVLSTSTSVIGVEAEQKTLPRSTAPQVRIPLAIREHAGLVRSNEPVVVGVPLPRGLVSNCGEWCIRDRRTGRVSSCQAERLADWPDGSVKWLSVTLLADVDAHEMIELDLCILTNGDGVNHTSSRTDQCAVLATQFVPFGSTPDAVPVDEPTMVIRNTANPHEFKSGKATFRFQKRGTRIVESARIDFSEALGQKGVSLECIDGRGRSRAVVMESLRAEKIGLLRCDLLFEGRVRRCGGLRITGTISVFAGGGLMRIEATLQNPGRARHRGGYWDLGDPGSVLLKGWRLNLDLSALKPQSIGWIESDSADAFRSENLPWRICQYSSGGHNWNSRNHVNRHNTVPLRMQGYRCNTPDSEYNGLRASPVVCVQGRASAVTCALTEFWEKFPSAIRFDGNHLLVEFWPDDFGDLHELQAGEHCTRVVWLRFDAAVDSDCRDLAWVHEPLVAAVDSAWLTASEAIPWLPDASIPLRPEAQSILNDALTGTRNFFSKRETIDEFGWRNFGDVWADHEEAYYNGPKPIISHYNNQYDLLYGLLVQFLLTGDRRWWQMADPLARHIMDIDVYHTTRDKSAYCGGLFWHTSHYLDAATSSHRTYSKWVNGPSGGPANEHAYSAGLLLYYYLTGDARAKVTVLQIADWIMAMDDGSQHVLGLFSDAPTGRASCTAESDYHGPGRGAGNAVGVLVDAWLASGDCRYIDFAENLIRRTIHPHDDIAARDLNNFELRWSYTVYLQQLARYLLVTDGIDRPNAIRKYVVASLVHYAEWMIDNDRFYFDYPEQLEYPTETWAAQEMRKGNVLFATSQFVDAIRGDRFRRRGEEIMERAWCKLMSFDSRGCTRPVALVLQQGYIESFFSSDLTKLAGSVPHCDTSAPPLPVFRSQREQLRAGLRSPISLLKVALCAVRPAPWWNVMRRSWVAESARRRLKGIC